MAAFTKALYDNQCNIEDTSMTLLEDHFTMLFIVHIPHELTSEHLEKHLKNVSQEFNLQLTLYPIETTIENPESSGTPWMISVSGQDQTGIMYHVTQYLAAQKVNIRHLSSKRLRRSSGETLFLMALEVDVPQSLLPEQIQSDLHALSSREGLEIHAEPLEVYTL